MDGNNPNINQGFESGNHQPNTIYNDLKNNPNYVPPQININNQNIPSSAENSGGYVFENNNIYSAAQSNNIGYAPQSSIYSQGNGDIYTQPVNNPPYVQQVSSEISPGYMPPTGNININVGITPQTSGETNPGFITQTNGNAVTPTTNYIPLNTIANSDAPTSSAPLISSTNKISTGGNCCTRTDHSLPELNGCLKGIIIVFGIVLVITSIINILVSLSNNDFYIIFAIDFAIIFYF